MSAVGILRDQLPKSSVAFEAEGERRQHQESIMQMAVTLKRYDSLSRKRISCVDDGRVKLGGGRVE